MKTFTYAIPCLFGLEGLVGDEVRRLGLEDVQVENGRVLCRGTGADLPRLNLNLRCGERVLLRLAEFSARRQRWRRNRRHGRLAGITHLPWNFRAIIGTTTCLTAV